MYTLLIVLVSIFSVVFALCGLLCTLLADTAESRLSGFLVLVYSVLVIILMLVR